MRFNACDDCFRQQNRTYFRTQPSKADSFQVALEQFIHQKSIQDSIASVHKYRQMRDKLNTLGPTLTFDDIDLAFYDRLLEWHDQKGYSYNTAGREIKFLKTFMKWAEDRKLRANSEYVKYKSFTWDIPVFFPTEEDLHLLEEPICAEKNSCNLLLIKN